VPQSGPGVTYDHSNQLALSQDDSDANIFPICDACRKPKDARDATARGKVRRLREKHDPDRLPRRGRKIQGPGFPKVHRPLKGRSSFDR
jgi:hypothetical protein